MAGSGYRLTAASGFAFVVAAVINISLLMSMRPAPNPAVPGEVIRWATEHRTTLFTNGWLNTYMVLFLVGFLFGLSRLAEPVGGARSALLRIGAAVLFGFTLLDAVMILSVPDAAVRGDGHDAATLWGIVGTLNRAFQMADVIFLSALAALLVHTRVLPAVFGIGAAGLAAMTAVFGPLSQVTGLDFLVQIPISLLILWVLAASAMLLARSTRPRSSVSPAG